MKFILLIAGLLAGCSPDVPLAPEAPQPAAKPAGCDQLFGDITNKAHDRRGGFCPSSDLDGTGNTEETYDFSLTATRIVVGKFEPRGPTPTQPADLYLYEGSVKIDSSVGVGTGDRRIERSLDAGSYALKVLADGAWTSSSYRLYLGVVSPPQTASPSPDPTSSTSSGGTSGGGSGGTSGGSTKSTTTGGGGRPFSLTLSRLPVQRMALSETIRVSGATPAMTVGFGVSASLCPRRAGRSFRR